MSKSMNERTLLLIKPDGVQRGLIGQIIGRLEAVGLKITALKMVHPKREDVEQHYTLTEEWMKAVFAKSKTRHEELGVEFPFPDHITYGTKIKNELVAYLMSSPVVAMVLEGEGAVGVTRKLVGVTEPASAAAGTIRGDLTLDSYLLSNGQNRPIRNLVHASGAVSEAEQEIKVWFSEVELTRYEHVNDRVQYDPTWFLPKEN